MKVFVTGSRGFIGRHVTAALETRGHRVVRGVSARHAAAAEEVVVDFDRDVDAALWRPKLNGIECVVNTVGTIGGDAERLRRLHVEAPAALFAACQELGVQVINVSALGADDGAQTAFHRTKRTADEALLGTHPFATVVQPSLVWGPEGASARLFTVLASLPMIPLPEHGEQKVQPIHVEDVASAIASLVGNRRFAGCRIPLVGPAAITLRTFLTQLREALRLRRARFVPVPAFVMSAAAQLGLPLVDRDMLSMLARGNVANPQATCELLGHPPRPVSQFVAPQAGRSVAREAKLGWLLPLLRFAIAVTWLAGAVTSAGLYPVADSVALVQRMGVEGRLATTLVYAGAAVDFLFGIATLVLARRRRLWLAQMAVIIGYTLMISLWLPEFWLHPFGPIVKNLPLLAALLLLYQLEER